MTELARLVRQLRDARDLTQGQLAEYSGVSRSYITKLEQGKIGQPSLDVLDRLAKVLHSSRAELLAATGEVSFTQTTDADIEALISDPEVRFQIARIGRLTPERRARMIRIIREMINGFSGEDPPMLSL